jgi:hypothetical protein
VLRVAIAAVAASALAPGAQGHLELRSRVPPTVRGTHFASHERVRVHLRAAGVDERRRVRAGRHGRFTVRFAGADISDRCSAFEITAVGVAGTTAKLRELPPRGCPPA